MTPGEYMTIHRLGPGEIHLFRGLLDVFGAVFEDPKTYVCAQPDDDYLAGRLADDTFFALVALADGTIVAGLAAYELKKFEQARSEIYIYDLAVDAAWRRKGIATRLIEHLVEIAEARGAWMVYVQADRGDEPAIALYTKLGRREDVLHFDIPVPGASEDNA